MAPFKALSERWEKEKRERIESERLFNVRELPDQLLLSKRLEPAKKQALPVVLFALAWVIVNWHIFQSPTNRGTWIGWVLLFCLVGPLLALPYLREFWRAHKGENWVFDRTRQSATRNGTDVVAFERIKHIRVWTTGGGENEPVSCLALVLKQDKPIVLAEFGNVRANWTELQEIARLIARYADLPISSA